MGDDTPDKRTGSYAQQEALGGEFISVTGYQTPYHFSHNESLVDEYDLPDHVEEASVIGAEHLHTRETVGLNPLPYNSAILVRGPSAPEFIQEEFTNDMDVDVGESRYAMLLYDDGGVQGDLIVTRTGEEEYYAFSLAGAACVEATERLRDHAPSDVGVTNLEDGLGCIGVYGQQALDAVQPLTSTDLSRDALPFYNWTEVEIDGIPTGVLRSSYVGEFGWEFWPLAGHEAPLWETLWDAVEGQGGTVYGVGALVSMGLEKGYHELGVDVGEDFTPFEAGLDHFVDMDTDFFGKDAIDPSPDRRRVVVQPDDATFVPDGEDAILADGDVVGELVRGGYGYSVESGIGIGFAPAEYADSGTAVELERDGERYAATVQDAPLFDPDDSRLR